MPGDSNCDRPLPRDDARNDPQEAIETGIKIAQAWQKDEPDKEILIATGGTGGYTMFFDGLPLTDENLAALRKAAEEEYGQASHHIPGSW